MNIFKWNLAHKCRRHVCFRTPNLSLIGKREPVQESPKIQNLPKIVVFGHRKGTQWTYSDEIRPVSVDDQSALANQIWPLSVIGGRYRSVPRVNICPKLWFLATESRHNEHFQMKFWQVSVDVGFASAHQIWPLSVKGSRYRCPQNSKFAQNCGFWPPENDTMNTFR